MSAGRVRAPGAEARGGPVPRAEPGPRAQPHPGTARLAAPRGAGGAVAGHPPAAVRDRGTGLVLPALPHPAAAARWRCTCAATCPAGCAGGDAASTRSGTATTTTPTSRSVEVSCLGRCDVAPAVAVNERPRRGPATADLVAAARAGTWRRTEAVRRGPAAAEAAGPTTPTRRAARATGCCGRLLAGDRTAGAGRRGPARTPGCGGWAAPASRPGSKWALVAAQPATPTYAICNADESEPGHLQGPADPGRPAAPGARGAAARDGRRRRRGGLGLRPARVRPGGGRAARRDRAAAPEGLLGDDVARHAGGGCSVEVFTSPGRLHPR